MSFKRKVKRIAQEGEYIEIRPDHLSDTRFNGGTRFEVKQTFISGVFIETFKGNEVFVYHHEYVVLESRITAEMITAIAIFAVILLGCLYLLFGGTGL
jgi:hypothetical protein